MENPYSDLGRDFSSRAGFLAHTSRYGGGFEVQSEVMAGPASPGSATVLLHRGIRGWLELRNGGRVRIALQVVASGV
jgi:hypothetical protein